jgi:hypothetical protein
MELVKFHTSSFSLMNPHDGSDKSNNEGSSKATAAMRIAGIVVAASLLLSGLSVIGNYNSVLAQQNITEGGARPTGVGGTTDNATTTTTGGTVQGGNATTTGAAGGNQSEVRLHLEEVRTALQNNDIQGALMHLDLALNVLGAGTQGNMTSTTSTR